MSDDALDPDTAAVCLDDALRDVQAKPRACAPRLARLPEPIEQVRQALRGNSRSRVGDAEHHLATGGARANIDAAAPRRELERVADEVGEDLEDTTAVGEDSEIDITNIIFGVRGKL